MPAIAEAGSPLFLSLSMIVGTCPCVVVVAVPFSFFSFTTDSVEDGDDVFALLSDEDVPVFPVFPVVVLSGACTAGVEDVGVDVVPFPVAGAVFSATSAIVEDCTLDDVAVLRISFEMLVSESCAFSTALLWDCAVFLSRSSDISAIFSRRASAADERFVDGVMMVAVPPEPEFPGVSVSVVEGVASVSVFGGILVPLLPEPSLPEPP